jgi:hypothetical protein
MSDIQRITAQSIAFGYMGDESDSTYNVEYVTYANHLAAVKEATQAVYDNNYVVATLSEWQTQIVAAEQRGIQKALIAWQEAEPLHDAEVLAAAVERVEALRYEEFTDVLEGIEWVDRAEVIAAIKGGTDE